MAKSLSAIDMHANNMRAQTERIRQYELRQEASLATSQVDGLPLRFEGPFLARGVFMSQHGDADIRAAILGGA